MPCYTAFGLRGFHHLVSLHHAAVGETAVVFIFLATPWERCVAASASARPGEPGCAIEIPHEQIHGTLQNLVGQLSLFQYGISIVKTYA